jgi:cytochrome c peroxidase
MPVRPRRFLHVFVLFVLGFAFQAAAQLPVTEGKSAVMQSHRQFLAERYDLADRPVAGVTMSGGKPVQRDARSRLPAQVTWETLAARTPEEIRSLDWFPAGFRPLPHPRHAEGGMLFPAAVIAELLRQEQRDLARTDLDFDLPEHFLPEFPAPIFLTTRADLGDVSRGQVVTLANYFSLFGGILNPKQLEGLRLLLTPFPQQQFNSTDDRRSADPSRGVACFDCHTNGHTNAATHLAGDTRPQAFRHRIDTPTLRGLQVQQLFGSQRALKSVEDFTEFEQRAAYFDGDPAAAVRKGANILDRGSQVHAMALCLSAGAEAERPGQARPGARVGRRAAGPGAVCRQGAVRGLPCPALLHRQFDA